MTIVAVVVFDVVVSSSKRAANKPKTNSHKKYQKLILAKTKPKLCLISNMLRAIRSQMLQVVPSIKVRTDLVHINNLFDLSYSI